MSAMQGITWKFPRGFKITTIDMHTGGEPLRIVVDGLPVIEGRTVLEKRRYFKERYDFLRTGLLWEPRGHADMYGAIVTPAQDADFDAFFLHNEGYSTMCGHAIIALTTLAIDSGMGSPGAERDQRRITFNVPAGRIRAHARLNGHKACDVSFRNVPSFVYLRDVEVDVPGLGRVRFDISYGGAFYALVEAASVGLKLTRERFTELIDAGRRIKKAVAAAIPINHPFETDLSFLYGVIFTGSPADPLHHSRNVCIFADGEVDRSATGSGVSARAALHYARGELKLNEPILVESILGTTMSVKVTEEVRFGRYASIVPEVGGSAFIIGRSEFLFDPDDPLKHGFILR
jgi:proline racemase